VPRARTPDFALSDSSPPYRVAHVLRSVLRNGAESAPGGVEGVCGQSLASANRRYQPIRPGSRFGTV
jgi:hypothetical protein